MKNTGDGQRPRFVVTVDSGEIDTAAIERLVHLALRLDAELEGVFVEDSDLLRLTGLTFLEEFRPTSLGSERFQPTRMQQELRAVARRAERSLTKYAEQRGVPWRFRVWRGSVERELLAAMEADVLALVRLGAVLTVPSRHRREETVSAFFDGSGEAARALVFAADLAGDDDHVVLQVLLAHDTGGNPEALKQRAVEVLSGYRGRITYVPVPDTGLNELLKALRDSGSSALVMQRGNSWLRHASLRQYLARVHCPLFLVR